MGLFGKRQQKEDINREKTPLDELAYLLGPEGFERCKEDGKLEEWKNRYLRPAMKASYKRLYENDKRWFGRYSEQEIINNIVRSTVDTWTKLMPKKLMVIQSEDPNKCYMHPLLIYGIGLNFGEELGKYLVEIRREDKIADFPIIGTLPLLEVEIDKKPRKNEFYIAVSKDIATIGLGLLEKEIKDIARCDYRLFLVERKEVRKEEKEIGPENMEMFLS